ncbi:serine--tRNA ligase [Limnoglobus roseus]|uniref:Serine--tRNA ligase n=1 Tax=Limnoglobus roseus TaxID=2598579 RepID=A0A5C1A7R7_9BACT|nr:serine--tRNA ligase [Limnoglobus roseus]QEL13892.1 serine--tRNA ligase [Limnoglobus roseus]
MLDANFIRDNLDAVKANTKNRNAKADVDAVVRLDAERKSIQKQADETKAKQNELSKSFQKTPKEQQAALREEVSKLKEQVTGFDAKLKEVEEALRAAILPIPNMTHPGAPVGSDPTANVVVNKVGEPTKFDFKPKDHVELVEALDLADFEAGVKVAGAKFYFLKNEAVLLELALVQYAMQKLVKHGFTPIITPDLAKVDVLEGIGFAPRDNAETRQVYTIADSDLCLIATAEITLGGMHRDEILDEAKLPLKYVGLSHCFRTEAGAAGRDTRGLYRVHQFTKVEMFAFCTPEQSDALHEDIRKIEEEIFTGLGLPFHVIDTCTGDLGGPAYRKYDLEAWMPGRGPDKSGEYGEVTSTSNCTDYQSRRLNIRYRPSGQKGTKFVHTLNGTAVACTRAMIAILENYQQADGTVIVPEVLRPWVGKDVITAK